MAQRTYDFRPPMWRPRSHLQTQTGALIFGSTVGALLWVALAWQLRHGFAPWAGLVPATATLCLLATVGMGWAWRRMLGRWRRAASTKLWPALNLEQTRVLSPADFEAYVAYRLFTRQGYQVDNLRAVKDGGIDLIVTDRQGRRAIVQCKRYRGTVGEAALRDLYGTMIHDGANMAFMITTGSLSAAARRWATGKPIVLIDGPRLVELAHAEPVVSNP